jgi:ABC-type uncharacterized transport system fused permease/ATPase subunit
MCLWRHDATMYEPIVVVFVITLYEQSESLCSRLLADGSHMQSHTAQYIIIIILCDVCDIDMQLLHADTCIHARTYRMIYHSQTAMAFRVIQGGLSVLVREVQRLANVAAETERLHYLMTTLEAINAERQYSIQDLLAAAPHRQQQQQSHGYYDMCNDVILYSSHDCSCSSAA